jgi:hypothetical protein
LYGGKVMNTKRTIFYLFAAIPIALVIIFCVKSANGFESSDIAGSVGSPLYASSIESFLTNGALTLQSDSEQSRIQAYLPMVIPYDSQTEKTMSTMGAVNQGEALFSATTKMKALSDSSHAETELKYYTEENLDVLLMVTCGHPCYWKSAIRLTQDEMAIYKNWTLTKVNVAFSTEGGCPAVDIRIYIYDKGTNTHPGPIIVNDTTYTLDSTGVTTIPLVTEVNLSGHDELWVAVDWYQFFPWGGYAWMDTISGPHIQNKSDFFYGGSWQQVHVSSPSFDGRWGIGAIIEGTGFAELSISDIEGPMGITAKVSNIGGKPADNVEWSIGVTGGILKMVSKTATGIAPTLAVGTSTPISLRPFIGLGKIAIIITAKAQNALEVSATKSGFLLGPFIVGIR